MYEVRRSISFYFVKKIFIRSFFLFFISCNFLMLHTKNQESKLDSLAAFLKDSHKMAYFQKHYQNLGLKKEKIKIKKYIVLSPPVVCGGPETLCLLANTLKEAGFETYMLWVDSFQNIIKYKKNNKTYLQGRNDNLIPKTYATRFDVKQLRDDVVLDQSVAIIVPEIWYDLIPFFENVQVYCYWLSLFNFLSSADSRLYRSFALTNDGFSFLPYNHLATTPYIARKLKSWGINANLLEDPISENYISQNKLSKKQNYCVAYNTHKGLSLAKEFVNLNPHYNYIASHNFSEFEMINMFDKAKIYIEFSHFPGREKIPREALSRDCIIFIHNISCGTDYDAYPISDYYRFSDADVFNGVLSQKIDWVFNNFEIAFKEQEEARNLIRCVEPIKFKEQALKHFCFGESK